MPGRASAAANTARTSASQRSPTAVSATLRLVRTRSWTPSSRFQGLDGLAQGWLGDVQAFGGAAEMQLLGDGDEISELPEIHPAHQIICTEYKIVENYIFHYCFWGGLESSADGEVPQGKEPPDVPSSPRRHRIFQHRPDQCMERRLRGDLPAFSLAANEAFGFAAATLRYEEVFPPSVAVDAVNLRLTPRPFSPVTSLCHGKRPMERRNPRHRAACY